jgi:hypothetical protein
MGRTIPSLRISLAMEKAEWKPFDNALDNFTCVSIFVVAVVVVVRLPLSCHLSDCRFEETFVLFQWS